MLRVGVQFERPASAVQASLDRFVFGLLRRKAEAKQPVASTPQPPDPPQPTPPTRRMATRVEIGPTEGLVVALLPGAPRGALAPAKASEVAPIYRLADLSTTGCAFLCENETLKAGTRLRLHLQGREIDVEVSAKVVYVEALP